MINRNESELIARERRNQALRDAQAASSASGQPLQNREKKPRSAPRAERKRAPTPASTSPAKRSAAQK